jgi:hypothetical protein
MMTVSATGMPSEVEGEVDQRGRLVWHWDGVARSGA